MCLTLTVTSCLAPEVAMSTPPKPSSELSCRGHGQPADLWSSGCLLFLMLTGRYPFTSLEKDREKVSDIISKVLSGSWCLPSNIVVSNEAKMLLDRLLEKDPTKRGTARKLLSHRFFTGKKTIILPSNTYRHDQHLSSSVNHSNPRTRPSSRETDQNQGAFMDQNVRGTCLEYMENGRTNDLLHHQEHHPQINSKQNPTEQHKHLNNIYQNDQQQPGSNPSTILEPLDALHRLPPMRHQWKEKETFFLLPNGLGAVLHSPGKGTWMHITGDGLRICIAELLEEPADKGACLIKEAFGRAPEQVQPSSPGGAVQKKARFYRPVSTLYKPKYRAYLDLFQKMHGIITSVKQSTPKITLYLHSPPTTSDENQNIHSPKRGDLIAKTTLMENGPLPHVVTEFVDDISITYRMSSGKTLLKAGSTLKLELDLSASHSSPFTDLGIGENSGLVKKYERYLRVSQKAVEECLRIEKTTELSRSPLSSPGRNASPSFKEIDAFPVVKKLILSLGDGGSVLL